MNNINTNKLKLIRLESELFDFAYKFTLLCESIYEGYIEVDKNNKITKCNKQFLNLIGYNSEEILKISYNDITSSNWQILEQNTIQEQVNKRGYSDLYGKEFIRKDGDVFYAELKAFLIKDEEDTPLGFWAIVTDVDKNRNNKPTNLETLRQLRLFKNLQIIVQTSHNLSSVFAQVYTIIQQYFDDSLAIRVNLLLYDEEQGGLISEQYFGLNRFGTKGEPQPIDYSISGKCFIEGKPIYIEDCSKTDLIPLKHVIELNLKSVLAVPVLFKSKPIGVLRIDDTKNTNAFNDADIELFSSVAVQLGILIENAKLIEQQEQYLESLKVIEKIYRDTIANTNGVAYSYRFGEEEYDFMGDGCEQIFEIPVKIIKHSMMSALIKERLVVDTLGPADYSEYVNLCKNGLRNRFQVQFRIVTPGGKKKWISDFSIPIKDQNTGDVIGLQGILQDITIQKRNEQINQTLLKISTAINSTTSLEELFPKIHNAIAGIIEAQNFYIALLDADGKNIIFPYIKDKKNPLPGEPLSLTTEGSLIGEIFCNQKVLLLRQDDLKIRYEKNAVSIPKCWLGASHGLNGVPISAVVVQSYNDSECYNEEDKRLIQRVAEYVAISVERKQAENEIKIKNEELIKINANKDKFFSIVAHDLRSPFQGFLGLTEILAEDTNMFTKEELSSTTKDLFNSARNLFKLLQNLLEWSQIQKGTISFTPKAHNLSDLISQNIEIVSDFAKQKRIIIINAVKKNQSIYADEKMIDSVLRNLLSNSIKFTKPGGKIIVSEINTQNDLVEISISDDGIGMSAEMINKLFKIEEKVGQVGTEGEPSTGLGLLLCKEFVEKNGGKIWVKSEERKGSTFCFTLKKLR